MARVRLTGGDDSLVYELSGDVTSIGRGSLNVIALTPTNASARHAQFVRDAEGWRIDDLGSRNGTYVNGARVSTARLSHGDRIRLGSAVLIFEDAAAPKLLIDESSGGDAMAGAVMTMRRVDRGAGSATEERRTAPTSRPVGAAERAPGESKVAGPGLAEAKLRLIQSVSEKLVRIFDPKRLTDEIMSIVIEQTGADRGFLCLLDKKGSATSIASRGLPPGQNVRISRTVLRRLLEERAGVLIEQTPAAGPELESLRRMRVVSTLCAPLWIGHEIIGFVSLDSTTPGKSFRQDDLDLLLAVAHQAAVGIERSRLAATAEKEQRIRAYLSKYLDDKVVERVTWSGAGEDPLAPREQVATVLFCDIVSFTKMSEGLKPAELADFVREYLTAMTEIIFAHGGTIDKYIGDAVMALFGAPVESPDSPAAAIRAALAMREHVGGMCAPRGEPGRLRVRYGINTGPLIVGNLGSARRAEYSALGDTVNVASRLQTFARPDEICIDAETYARTAGLFAVQEIGTIDVKNRAQPVVVYKVLGET